MDIPLSSVNTHEIISTFLIIVTTTSVNICVQVFVWTFLQIYLSVEVLGHVVTLCLKGLFWIILIAERLQEKEKMRALNMWILKRIKLCGGLNLKTPTPWWQADEEELFSMSGFNKDPSNYFLWQTCSFTVSFLHIFFWFLCGITTKHQIVSVVGKDKPNQIKIEHFLSFLSSNSISTFYL